VIVVLAIMLLQSLHEQTDSGGRTVNARGVRGGALAQWSGIAKAPGRIHVQLDSVPSKIERAWLAALAGAGSIVTWSGDLVPLMLDAQPGATPTGGTKVLVAVPGGSSVVLADDVGPIDTVRGETVGATLALNSKPDHLTARVNGSVASTDPRDSVVLHKVLVIGSAGWESKFVVVALEEEGWKVDALIRVAPGVDVKQGSAAAIDTSRYSAVIALDSSASPYANRIIQFVRTGGGVILEREAAAVDAMAPLRAGAVGRATSELHAGLAAEVSLSTLALAPITLLRSDAVPVEKRASSIAIAARRIAAGRALQIGYKDTWRWRMDSAEGALRDHRSWWTGLVSSVAYAPRVPTPTVNAGPTDEAPMIGLIGALGPNAPSGLAANLSGGKSDLTVFLFVLLALGLTGEVASRRLRGVT
jgi:hypothetical protein